jgi:hypothetical protein
VSKKSKMSHAVRNKKKQLLEIYKNTIHLLLKRQTALFLRRLVMWKKGKMNNYKMKKKTESKVQSAEGVPGKMMTPSPHTNCNSGCSQKSEHIVTSILVKQQPHCTTAARLDLFTN